MATKDYDPPLSQAVFMDLVFALDQLMRTDASLKSVGMMTEEQRDAAMRLGDAAAHYRSIVEPR